jgi:hypothetical protein
MIRTLTIAIIAVLASSVLSAQHLASATLDDNSPVVVEMKIERSLSPESNGVADLIPSVDADKLILTYTLQNIAKREVALTRITTSGQVNCHAMITRRPASTVAANGSTTMVIEVKPQDRGPLSFTVSMVVDGREYSFPVQATVSALLHSTSVSHDHDDDDHHCSTSGGGTWLLIAGAAAILGTLALRRRTA